MPTSQTFGSDVCRAMSLPGSELLSLFYHSLVSTATVPFPISGNLLWPRLMISGLVKLYFLKFPLCAHTGGSYWWQSFLFLIQLWWNSGTALNMHLSNLMILIIIWGVSSLFMPSLQMRKINSLRVTLPAVGTLNLSCLTSALTFLATFYYDFPLCCPYPYPVPHVDSTSPFHTDRLAYTLFRGEDFKVQIYTALVNSQHLGLARFSKFYRWAFSSQDSWIYCFKN